MPSGTLTAFGMPAMIAPFWDHTYVTSSAGHVWPCWGRSAGGSQICSGVGNTDQAACLAQPNFDAGINYGKTGVCHQMANRILFPARQMVSAAKGYRASIFVFGVYGLDLGTLQHYSPVHKPWQELLFCQTNHTHP